MSEKFIAGFIIGFWIAVCLGAYASTYVDWSTVRFHVQTPSTTDQEA